MDDSVSDAIDALPPLRDVIATHGLRAEKSLGQNFLLDLNLTDKIARVEGALDGLDVIEIGPGPGGLTRRLLAQGARTVTALEKDFRAIGALQDLVKASGRVLEVREEDALQVDLQSIGADGARAVIANLPYNIATPLLINWLSDINQKGRDAYIFMALMFQKEVAERICARVGQKEYGRLSVISQAICDVKLRIKLPPNAFTPPPKVSSAVVVFKPKEGAESVPFSILEEVSQKAFGQRRKMVRSSLKEYMHALEALGIEGTRRAEELHVEDYIAIATYLNQGQ